MIHFRGTCAHKGQWRSSGLRVYAGVQELGFYIRERQDQGWTNMARSLGASFTIPQCIPYYNIAASIFLSIIPIYPQTYTPYST